MQEISQECERHTVHLETSFRKNLRRALPCTPPWLAPFRRTQVAPAASPHPEARRGAPSHRRAPPCENAIPHPSHSQRARVSTTTPPTNEFEPKYSFSVPPD